MKITRKENKHLHGVLRFIANAQAKSSTRYAINGIHVEDNAIVATDGRRMHWYEGKHSLPDGLYKVKSNTKGHIVIEREPDESAGIYPKWREIADYMDIIETHTLSYFPPTYIAEIYRLTDKPRTDGLKTTYNIQYILDSMFYDGCDSLREAKLQLQDCMSRPVKISYDFPEYSCNVIIMPVNG
jgi:hypothetical protein